MELYKGGWALMELSSWIYYLLALILLLIFSAFFSGMEAALFSASRIKLESMALRGSIAAKKILELKNNPTKIKKFKKNIRNLLEEHYNWDTNLEVLNLHYRKIISQ